MPVIGVSSRVLADLDVGVILKSVVKGVRTSSMQPTFKVNWTLLWKVAVPRKYCVKGQIDAD